MAHITNVFPTNGNGVEVKVRDHTGTADFAPSGYSARIFYDLHLPGRDPRVLIVGIFALRGTWFGTYLFKKLVIVKMFMIVVLTKAKRLRSAGSVSSTVQSSLTLTSMSIVPAGVILCALSIMPMSRNC